MCALLRGRFLGGAGRVRHQEIQRGYRPNVAAIIAHPGRREVLWCRRVDLDFWQFPQGGLDKGESERAAVLREVEEETGIAPHLLRPVASTSGWLHYEVMRGRYQGQAQRWFLLEFLGQDSDIRPAQVAHPEFDDWVWASYWFPLRDIIEFKREVYRAALLELWPSFVQLTGGPPSL